MFKPLETDFVLHTGDRFVDAANSHELYEDTIELMTSRDIYHLRPSQRFIYNGEKKHSDMYTEMFSEMRRLRNEL